MATSGSIEDIKELVLSNTNEQYNKLNTQWSKDIKESNDLISKIEHNHKYIEKNSFQVSNMIERLNNKLDYYTELGIELDHTEPSPYNFPEIRRNLEKNYRTLSLQYYKYNFEKTKKQYTESQKILDEIANKQKDIIEKMDKTDNRIESLGSTFLNIVLTISITTSMVAVLLNASPKYSLAIVLCCAWLLLSVILFVSSYFKSDTNKNNKLAIRVYVILSIVTLISFCFCFFTSDYIETRNQSNAITDNN